MSGRNSFSKLKQNMPPERFRAVESRTHSMLAEMLLPEIRQHSGYSQSELAGLLGITQPSLSKLEHQDDMQISTLSRLVEALGGKLEIIAHLPSGDCRLTQFDRS